MLLPASGAGLTLGIESTSRLTASGLAVTADHGVAVWDVVGGRLIRNVGEHAKEVGSCRHLAATAQSCLPAAAIISSSCGTSRRGALLKTFAGHANWVEHVALSSDSRYAASGSSIDGIIKIWDIESGKQLQELRGHTRPRLPGSQFSPDRAVAAVRQLGRVGNPVGPDAGGKRFDFKTDVRDIYNPKSETNEQAQRAIDWVGFSQRRQAPLGGHAQRGRLGVGCAKWRRADAPAADLDAISLR